jgi:hypothetical protein
VYGARRFGGEALDQQAHLAPDVVRPAEVAGAHDRAAGVVEGMVVLGALEVVPIGLPPLTPSGRSNITAPCVETMFCRPT